MPRVWRVEGSTACGAGEQGAREGRPGTACVRAGRASTRMGRLRACVRGQETGEKEGERRKEKKEKKKRKGKGKKEEEIKREEKKRKEERGGIHGGRSRMVDRQPSGKGWDVGEEKERESEVRSVEKGEEKVER